jgi:hypothetical protein
MFGYFLSFMILIKLRHVLVSQDHLQGVHNIKGNFANHTDLCPNKGVKTRDRILVSKIPEPTSCTIPLRARS